MLKPVDEISPFDQVRGREPTAEDTDDEDPRQHRLRWVLRIFILLAAVIVVGIWFGRGYIFSADVPAFVVSREPAAWTLRGPGLLDATNRVVVSARTQGRIRTMLVDRNDPVTKGQILARLENDEISGQLAGAKADAEVAERAIAEARSAEQRSKIGLDKLALDLDRRRRLAATGAATKADLDGVEAAWRQAQTEVERASITIARTEAQKRSADANVTAIEARLEDAVIRSPLDGLVTVRDRTVGDLVIPGASIVQLVDPKTIVVSARFDESAMSSIESGLPAEIEFTSTPKQKFLGRLMRIGRTVDQETREFTIDLSLEQLPRNWALGQRTIVEIKVLTAPGALVIPNRFVVRSEGRAGVWLYVGGRARWRPIQLGGPSGPHVEVTDGLAPGDMVLEPHGRFTWESMTAVRVWQ